MSCNYVDNIMVHADPFHSYCVALIVPSRQAIETWARGAGIEYTDFSDICQNNETVGEVQQSLLKVSPFCLLVELNCCCMKLWVRLKREKLSL